MPGPRAERFPAIEARKLILMRPFAHSGAIHVATQVGPAIMNLLGKRAMTSQNGWIRKFGWPPQTVGGSMSFRAGMNNLAVVH